MSSSIESSENKAHDADFELTSSPIQSPPADNSNFESPPSAENIKEQVNTPLSNSATQTEDRIEEQSNPPPKNENEQKTEGVAKENPQTAGSLQFPTLFHNTNANILSTRSRIEVIAKQYHIGAFIRPHASTQTPSQRCLDRRNYIALKQQNNLEKIMQYAYFGSKETLAVSPDPDWLARFMEIAQNIHGDAMQRMWGRILRKELITPNYIALKSLSTLESMSPKEVELFQKACALTCRYGNDSSRKIIIGYERPALFPILGSNSPNHLSLGDHQLSYSNLLVLMDLGLIFRSELLSGAVNKDAQLSLFFPEANYQLKARYNRIKLVYYRLTQMGNELCHVLGVQKRQSYVDALLGLLSQGFDVKM